MATTMDRPCANPACFCHTADVTCSLWCGTLDRPADVRCLCRHDGCARPLARTSAWSARVALEPVATGQRPRLSGVRAG
jgi:hypothetical protein